MRKWRLSLIIAIFLNRYPLQLIFPEPQKALQLSSLSYLVPESVFLIALVYS